MTVTGLLLNAETALTLVQTFPLTDPRVTLAIQLLAGTVSVVQSLHRRGIFDPTIPIEVEEIGLALTANIQAQLKALGMDPV